MRPLLLFAPAILGLATAGCVAPPATIYQPGYAQPAYAQPVPDLAPAPPVYADPGDQDFTYYDDRPVILYGSTPAYIIEDPGLGWGWYDPYRHWHPAPPRWHERLDRGGYRGAPGGYRPQGGYRPGYQPGNDRPNGGRQPQGGPQGRPQGTPMFPQRGGEARPGPQSQGRPMPAPQQQRPAPQSIEHPKNCPPGRMFC